MSAAGSAQPTIQNMERRNTVTTTTTCRFCGEEVVGGGSAHWACGGVLPDSERECPIAIADHVVRLLERKTRQGKQMKRRPWTRQELWGHVRPELAPYFKDGLNLAVEAGKIRRDGSKFTLTPTRVPQRPERDDGSAIGLFDLPA
jgi:hypothetical protein